ncbi:MAG TPA: bifunctional riboflavin kinase/FAD synthetase [Mycobacteriales bacterium]|nr:bifunctional riboflavin kinase/FAD synthetase [Mycobacteriales bacterium]
MRRWRGLEHVPTGWGRCVVTIGVFDGVHRGHQVIIGRAIERARAADLPAVVLTFDPHPSEVVRPGSHPAVLTGPRHQADLLEALGVDVLLVVPFTLEFSRRTPEQFAHAVLVQALHAQLVVVGENFRFGHRAAGDVARLGEIGRTFGFAVEAVGLEGGAEATFSSTYVRACVAAGDVLAAAAALGRPHRVEGVVVRGDKRGRGLGFPTANLELAAHAAVPADGVYAGWLWRGAERWPAAISIGTNPTFSGRELRVEAHALDAEPDLYGEHVALDVVARIRDMCTFAEVADLVRQMQRDVEDVRAALARQGHLLP